MCGRCLKLLMIRLAPHDRFLRPFLQQVAIDSKKRAYSWGFGGVGRLGHAEQKDEMVPRMIKFFDSSSRGVRSVFCGSSYSMAINELGVLFMFGQNKKTGEANMYPKPVQDLAGKIW